MDFIAQNAVCELNMDTHGLLLLWVFVIVRHFRSIVGPPISTTNQNPDTNPNPKPKPNPTNPNRKA